MKEAVGVYFVVARIISLIIGIIACITIVGAIIGIPLIIGSNKFKEASNMTDEELVRNRGSILGWGIFTAIILSPTIIGLIILLCMTMMVDNYIKNIEQGNFAKNQQSFSETVESGVTNAVDGIKNTFSKSDIDKQKNELLKLDKLRDEGLITSDEYDKMRKKILGIDD
jgi:uncharacterized membrane protein